MDEVQPAAGTTYRSRAEKAVHEYGALVGGWIVPADTDIAAGDRGAAGVPLDAFAATHAPDSLTVTIGTGEAFVHGAHLFTDTTTTVDLAASTAGQVVRVGWSQGGGNDVRIDVVGGPDEPEFALDAWTFDTDATGVIAANRVVEPGMEHAESELFLPLGGGEITGPITTTLDGFTEAPFKIAETTAYSQYEGYATIYNQNAAGWRFRDGSSGGDALVVDNATHNVSTEGGDVQNVRETGSHVVIADDAYEIQINGTDGPGIINLKTE